MLLHCNGKEVQGIELLTGGARWWWTVELVTAVTTIVMTRGITAQRHVDAEAVRTREAVLVLGTTHCQWHIFRCTGVLDIIQLLPNAYMY